MDVVSQSITESVTSGQYFRDALIWYRRKYLHPHTQRFYVMWLCIVLALTTLMVVVCVNSLFPLEHPEGFIVFSKNTIGEVPVTTKLKGTDVESAFRLVARHLLKSYVIERESYRYTDLTTQDAYMRNSSTRPVYGQFTELMQPDNPLSPMRLYQWNYMQQAEVLAVNFVGHDAAPERAVVTYTVALKDDSGAVIKQTSAVANIVFTMPLIEDMIDGKSKMSFQVRSYHTTVLE